MGKYYTLGTALFAATGTFLFGFDTGVTTTTIARQSWSEYMGHPSNGLTGAAVAIYIAGEAGGALCQTFVGDRLGRIRFMQMMCVVVTIGVVIQTATINVGIFLAGRGLAGFDVGGMVSTVPIYLSEIAAPKDRGMIGGIFRWRYLSRYHDIKMGWLCGFVRPIRCHAMASASRHADTLGVIMFVGLARFMPHSPRQLIRSGKIEQARIAFVQPRRDLESLEADEEFALMSSQIQFEMEQEITSIEDVFKLF